MSALPPIADIFSVEIDVCFVPQADMAGVISPTALLSEQLPEKHGNIGDRLNSKSPEIRLAAN
jgi:hypothetical protein